MVRAVRFATRLGLALDPATEAAIVAHAAEVASLSGERVRDELLRMLARLATGRSAIGRAGADGAPGAAGRAAARAGGAARRAAGQGAAPATRWTTRCAPPTRCPPIGRVLRLAGLLHDLGKATTLADGHFIGHDVEGARMAEEVLHRLRLPRDGCRLGRAPGAAAHVRLHPRLDRCRRAPVRPPRGSGPAGRPLRAARCRQRGERRPRAGDRRDGRAARARGGGAGQRRAGAGPAGDRRATTWSRSWESAPGPQIGELLRPSAGGRPGRPVAEHQGAVAGPGPRLAVGAWCLRRTARTAVPNPPRGQTTDPLLQSAILGQCPPSPPTFAHKEDLRTLTATGRRAARLEHRLTRANASLAELDAAVALAVEHDCAAVTVTPVAGQGGPARAGT